MAILVAVAGAGLGSAIGIGSSAGWIIGGIVGGLLFPPDPVVTEGPRLGDLSVTSSAYGSPRTIGFGTIRQSGNMIWTTGIREQKNTRKVGGGKGMGGPSQEQISYTYFATFAVAFGEGEADDVLRIWADGKLIFDKRGTGTNTRKAGLNFRFYPGTETQLPDSAISADKGESNTPAFRGTVYVVFDDIALADFGNRVPSITAEIAYSATAANLSLEATNFAGGTTSYASDSLAVDWDRQLAYVVSASDNYLRRINLTTMLEDRQVPGASTFLQVSPETTVWRSGPLVVMPDGGLVTTANESGGGNSEPIVRIDPNTLTETNRFGFASNSSSMFPDKFGFITQYAAVSVFSQKGQLDFLLCGQVGGQVGLLAYPDLSYIWDSENLGPLLSGTIRGMCSGLFGQGFGEAYFISSDSLPISGPINIYKISIDAGAAYDAGSVTAGGISVSLIASFSPGDIVSGETALLDLSGLVYDETDNTLMFGARKSSDSAWVYRKFDPATSTFVWQTSNLAGGPNIGLRWDFGRIQDNTLGFFYGQANGVLINTQTGALLRNGEPPDWSLLSHGNTAGLYDSRTESWVNVTAATETPVLGRWFFRRGSGDGSTLANIVQVLSNRADLNNVDLDVTDLASIDVPGFVVGRQTTARAAIETLSQLYFFDGVESDFLLKFTLRGGESVRTIPQQDMAFIEQEKGEFIKENRTQEVELPERFTVTYMDKDKDYTQNAHNAKRVLQPEPSMYSRNQMGISAAVAISSDTAKQQAEKALYSAWIERNSYELRLPWSHLVLDPADVVTFTLDNGVEFRTRIAQFDVGVGFAIDVNALSEEVAQFTSSIIADSGSGVPEQTVKSEEVIKTLLLDVPLLRDADEPTGRTYSPLYFFMGGYSDAGFTRGSLYKSSDEVVYDNVSSLLSGMSWGATSNAIADPPFNNPFATDTVNTLTVFMNTGSSDLESVTSLQLLNGSNAAALFKTNGEIEVIQYQDVTPNADGSFTLSTLLRGRRGTDAMTNNHTVGETFLLLIPADADIVPLGLSELNVIRYYRGAGAGQLLEQAERLTNTSKHRPLMPYAPVQVEAVVNVTDIDISWTRRTRVGGALLDLLDRVPLAEDSERYEIDILDGPDGTILRTITSLTAVSYKYLNTDILTDFGSMPTQMSLRVYQVSAQVGRGFTREVTVDVQ